MRVQCPHCGVGGNIPDHKVPAAGTNLKCPKCGASFFVKAVHEKTPPGQQQPNTSPHSTTTPVPSQEHPSPKRNPIRELLDKGTECLDNAQYNHAIEAFQEVCRVDPKNSYGYFGLAMVYEKKNAWTKAIDAYQKVLELNPKDTLAQANLKFLKKQQKKFHFPWKKKER